MSGNGCRGRSSRQTGEGAASGKSNRCVTRGRDRGIMGIRGMGDTDCRDRGSSDGESSWGATHEAGGKLSRGAP